MIIKKYNNFIEENVNTWTSTPTADIVPAYKYKSSSTVSNSYSAEDEENDIYYTVSSVFKSLEDSKEKPFNAEDLSKKLKKSLTRYRDDVVSSKRKMSKKHISALLDKMIKDYDEELLDGLNIETFFRGLLNISVGKEAEDIEEFFDNYINTIDDRILNMHLLFCDKIDDDERFTPFKQLRKKMKTTWLEPDVFNRKKLPLQLELLKLQEWVKKNNKKVLILFEGRDSAGKGSVINTIIEYLDPKCVKHITFGVPKQYEVKNWFFRYNKNLPQPGTITLFDRSWYNRAVNDPSMGYCTDEQYTAFIEKVNDYEKDLINNEKIILIKFWFSITKETQQTRFNLRKLNPLKYWKYSPNDEASMSKWDVFTKYKEQMFERTSTELSPWVVVDSNDKRVAKLNVMRWILNKIPYTKKKKDLLYVYPEVIYEI